MTTYSEIRDEIQSGDLVVLSHYKWASWYDFQVMIVRVMSATEYTHVGVCVVLGGRVWVAESVEPVVRLVPLSNYAADGMYIIPARHPMKEEELEYLFSKVGKAKYSKWRAIKAYLDRLEIGTDDELECAEYAITARRLSGLDLGHKAVPSCVVKEALKQGLRLEYVEGF